MKKFTFNKFFKRFDYLAGTLKGFCRNILVLLLTVLNFTAIFLKIVITLLVRVTPSNQSFDVSNKGTNIVNICVEVVALRLTLFASIPNSCKNA